MLGLSIISGGILTERTWYTLDRLRATPARPVHILIGKAVAYGAVLVAQQAVVIAYIAHGVIVLGLPVRRPDLVLLTTLAWAPGSRLTLR